MDYRRTPIERAFELARSGDYSSVSDIRRMLVVEGYELYQITGPSLLSQLRKLIQSARATSQNAKPAELWPNEGDA